MTGYKTGSLQELSVIQARGEQCSSCYEIQDRITRSFCGYRNTLHHYQLTQAIKVITAAWLCFRFGFRLVLEEGAVLTHIYINTQFTTLTCLSFDASASRPFFDSSYSSFSCAIWRPHCKLVTRIPNLFYPHYLFHNTVKLRCKKIKHC